MFDGVGSPLTQTFGLGLTQSIAPDDIEAIERFYRERGSDTALLPRQLHVPPSVGTAHVGAVSLA
jgi:hypothetical protein